jgi:hypothetical protein
VNPFERGEIGPDLFQAACRMGLEGVVSKNRPYQAGRSKYWGKDYFQPETAPSPVPLLVQCTNARGPAHFEGIRRERPALRLLAGNTCSGPK